MSIPVTVARPQGAGPFPAVVVMHDCSGLGPRSSGAPARWTETLVARGYVVIRPDSFSTRGHPDGVCTAARPALDVSPVRRVKDAYEAPDYARRLPYVDGRRVAIMGGSHGGSTTLVTLARGAGFAAGVALYPRCTPARYCEHLAGGDITVKVYRGAHHSFDSDRPVRFVAERLNPAAPGGRGATTGGNAQAWKDAIEQVAAFFDRHLK